MKQHAPVDRIYRHVFWSEGPRAWVAVAENSRRQGNRSSRRLLAATPSLSAVVALADPIGGQIGAGSGSVYQSGNTMTIEQSNSTLASTSQSFNIASQPRVDFMQPPSSAIAINRVLGNSGTPMRLWTSDGRSDFQ
jgi:hypothetical protein